MSINIHKERRPRLQDFRWPSIRLSFETRLSFGSVRRPQYNFQADRAIRHSTPGFSKGDSISRLRFQRFRGGIRDWRGLDLKNLAISLTIAISASTWWKTLQSKENRPQIRRPTRFIHRKRDRVDRSGLRSGGDRDVRRLGLNQDDDSWNRPALFPVSVDSPCPSSEDG